jgi:hypothetical protein
LYKKLFKIKNPIKAQKVFDQQLKGIDEKKIKVLFLNWMAIQLKCNFLKMGILV